MAKATTKTNKSTKTTKTTKKPARKRTPKQEEPKITGVILAWVVITIIAIIFNVVSNFLNPVAWVMNILLVVALIMLIKGRGTRWFMVVFGAAVCVICLITLFTVTPSSICVSNWTTCFNSSQGSRAWGEMHATFAKVGSVIIMLYFGSSAIFFAVSKRVKERFEYYTKKAKQIHS